MNATEIKNAAADILATLANNVASTKRALEIAKIQPTPGFVFVWPEYWLGILVEGDKSRAVGISHATIVRRTDKRAFTNGHGEQAILMNVIEALEGALAHGIAVQADMTARIAKTT